MITARLRHRHTGLDLRVSFGDKREARNFARAEGLSISGWEGGA